MGIFDWIFVKKRKKSEAPKVVGDAGRVYRVGESVNCMKCGRSVKIQSPRKDLSGKILVASVDDMMPFAFRCRHCDYITCAECSLLAYKLHNPREGIPTCPSCKEVHGPMFFTEWLQLRQKGGGT